MNNQEFLRKLEKYAQKNLENDKTGHDYKHTKRVLKNALMIARYYPETDREILIVACLLHDIAFKYGFVKKHHIIGANQAEKILKKFNFPKNEIKKVKIVIEDHVRNTTKPIRPDSKLLIESKILVDADNLDALGEIGIRRAIRFNKILRRPKFNTKKDKFNESLYGSLKEIVTWPDKMFTLEGKRIGRKRVRVIKDFIKKLEEKDEQSRIS